MEHNPVKNTLRIFAKYFGQNRTAWRRVCTFGFELNPKHEPRLRHIEALYRSRGWPVTIYTKTAVGVADEPTTFWGNSPGGPQYGGGLMQRDMGALAQEGTSVRMLDFSRWLRHNVLARCVPQGQGGGGAAAVPAVVVKMDVEGAEWMVLPALLADGSICAFSSFYMEWHGSDTRRVREQMSPQHLQRTPLVSRKAIEARIRALACNVTLEGSDDETFGQEGWRAKNRRYALARAPPADDCDRQLTTAARDWCLNQIARALPPVNIDPLPASEADASPRALDGPPPPEQQGVHQP